MRKIEAELENKKLENDGKKIEWESRERCQDKRVAGNIEVKKLDMQAKGGYYLRNQKKEGLKQ